MINEHMVPTNPIAHFLAMNNVTSRWRIEMIPTTKVVCAIAALVFYLGVPCAYAAHPSAETHPSDDRGSQGNQDMIKGDSTPKKGEDEKVDDAKLKADTIKAREEFEKRNARGQGHPSSRTEAQSNSASGSNLRMQQNSGGTPTNPESNRTRQGGGTDPLSDGSTIDPGKGDRPAVR
ncbi:MAG TPA: hypothetical protein VJU54_08165 [Nitrospiraceae bacterium]|nr:hypothetical protein [Nitrospiraceae bacterium]